MTDLQKLNAAAWAVGATVEDDSVGYRRVLQVVSPADKQWIDGGCHCLMLTWLERHPGAAAAKSEAICDAIERIKCGLVECPADCECREGGGS